MDKTTFKENLNAGELPGRPVFGYLAGILSRKFARLTWGSSFAVLLLVLVSCSKNDQSEDPTFPPGPEPEQAYTLKYKTTEVLEFKRILNGTAVSDLPAEKQNELFGNRMKYACPTELRLLKDSLTIVKPGGISEQYKAKIDNNELFIYDDVSSDWTYCGKKESGTRLSLNTAFFIKTRSDHQRQLSVVGQEYSVVNYSAVIGPDDKEGSDIKWLKVQYNFE